MLAAAASMLLNSAAFADYITAPGVDIYGRTMVGPGAAAEVVTGTDASAPVVDTGAQAPAAETGVQPPAESASGAQSSAPADAQTGPVSTGGPGAQGGPGSSAPAPAQSQQVQIQAPAAAVNTGLPAGGMQAGSGALGEGVSADSVLGTVPLINAVMIDPAGAAEAPFSTDTGAFMSTSDGFSGLWLCYDRAIGDVYYRVFTNEHGWSQWAMNEMRTPNYGDGARVTAVEIRTNGHTANQFSIFYRAILNDGTNLGWARDGMAAGAFGNGKYIQGLEIKLIRRGTGSTGGYQQGGAYEGVIAGANGQAQYSTFDGRAFTGWAYDTNNNKYYFVNNNIVTGWQYIDGYKYYFDANGRVVTDLEPIMGLTGDYIIKINKSMKTLTVYTKDGDNGYIIPYKVILTTIGDATPIGTFKTYEAYRWKYMHDAEGGAYYCQFLLRFKNGFILHSIIYQSAPDPYHLIADTYNMLGKNQSDGCVRMLSGDAAWVYNNCGVGTQVEIYRDEWVPGPLDRPAIQQAIPRDQKFDPTDPVIISKQQESSAAADAARQEAATGVEAPPTLVDGQ